MRTNNVEALTDGKKVAYGKRDKRTVVPCEIILASRLDFVAPSRRMRKKSTLMSTKIREIIPVILLEQLFETLTLKRHSFRKRKKKRNVP